MKLTMNILEHIFLEVLEERMSFPEASDWASDIIEKDERGELEFNNQEDITKIFSGLTYLSGIDIQESPGVYLHTLGDLKEKYNKIFCKGHQ